MGGCLIKTKEKSVEALYTIQQIVSYFFAKKKKKTPSYREESESYETEMLLSSEGIELTAGNSY